MKDTIKKSLNQMLEHEEKIFIAIENVFEKVGFSELDVPTCFIRDVVIGEINQTEGLGAEDFYPVFDGVIEKMGVNN